MNASSVQSTAVMRGSRALSCSHSVRVPMVSSHRSRNCTRQVTSMAGHGKFFVGGNWKCNGTKDSINKLVNDLNAANVPEDIDIIVAPTFVHIEQVRSKLDKKFVMAAQNCWVGRGGAYTGEISAEQLHDLDVPWVIVGHSERRALLEEDNDFVGHKAAYALSQDLSVIACIGETLSERESGKMYDVLTDQLTAIGDNIAGTSLFAMQRSTHEQFVCVFESCTSLTTWCEDSPPADRWEPASSSDSSNDKLHHPSQCLPCRLGQCGHCV